MAAPGPRAVLDACVLYPTVTREVLLGVARRGVFVPLWSARLLEEWRRAAARRGPVDAVQAEGEIAVARAGFPQAEIAAAPGQEARLWLPDENDVHVLATAVAASADLIITWNAQDFPRGVLAEEGLRREDPDRFLLDLWQEAPEDVEGAAREVLATAVRIDGAGWTLRALMKKARLPRLGKALGD